MQDNRRNCVRQRVLRDASVVFNGRQSVMHCTIRNWSETGAMVRMSDWIALPAVFEIDLENRCESVRVRQCWRRGDDVGVAFVSGSDLASTRPVSLMQFRAKREKQLA